MKTHILCVLVIMCMLLGVGSACASVSAGDVIEFGHYEQEAPNQVLQWRVLGIYGDTAVLLSDKVIDCRPFNIDGSCDWLTSELRSWLNYVFAYQAFTAEERAQLLPDMDGSYVVIPTLGDMTNADFGFSDKKDAQDATRAVGGTSHAINNGLWTKNGLCSWFVRTETSNKDLYQVRTNGAIGVATPERDNVGIRPLIYITVSE